LRQRQAILANDVKSTSAVQLVEGATNGFYPVAFYGVAFDHLPITSGLTVAEAIDVLTVQAAIIHNTLANDLTSPSSVQQGANLRQVTNLLANDVKSTPKVGNPQLGIVGTVDARDLVSPSSVSQPVAGIGRSALADDVTSLSIVSQPAQLRQLQTILANDVASTSFVLQVKESTNGFYPVAFYGVAFDHLPLITTLAVTGTSDVLAFTAENINVPVAFGVVSATSVSVPQLGALQALEADDVISNSSVVQVQHYTNGFYPAAFYGVAFDHLPITNELAVTGTADVLSVSATNINVPEARDVTSLSIVSQPQLGAQQTLLANDVKSTSAVLLVREATNGFYPAAFYGVAFDHLPTTNALAAVEAADVLAIDTLVLGLPVTCDLAVTDAVDVPAFDASMYLAVDMAVVEGQPYSFQAFYPAAFDPGFYTDTITIQLVDQFSAGVSLGPIIAMMDLAVAEAADTPSVTAASGVAYISLDVGIIEGLVYSQEAFNPPAFYELGFFTNASIVQFTDQFSATLSASAELGLAATEAADITAIDVEYVPAFIVLDVGIVEGQVYNVQAFNPDAFYGFYTDPTTVQFADQFSAEILAGSLLGLAATEAADAPAVTAEVSGPAYLSLDMAAVEGLTFNAQAFYPTAFNDPGFYIEPATVQVTDRFDGDILLGVWMDLAVTEDVDSVELADSSFISLDMAVIEGWVPDVQAFNPAAFYGFYTDTVTLYLTDTLEATAEALNFISVGIVEDVDTVTGQVDAIDDGLFGVEAPDAAILIVYTTSDLTVDLVAVEAADTAEISGSPFISLDMTVVEGLTYNTQAFNSEAFYAVGFYIDTETVQVTDQFAAEVFLGVSMDLAVTEDVDILFIADASLAYMEMAAVEGLSYNVQAFNSAAFYEFGFYTDPIITQSGDQFSAELSVTYDNVIVMNFNVSEGIFDTFKGTAHNEFAYFYSDAEGIRVPWENQAASVPGKPKPVEQPIYVPWERPSVVIPGRPRGRTSVYHRSHLAFYDKAFYPPAFFIGSGAVAYDDDEAIMVPPAMVVERLREDRKSYAAPRIRPR